MARKKKQWRAVECDYGRYWAVGQDDARYHWGTRYHRLDNGEIRTFSTEVEAQRVADALNAAEQKT